MEEEGPARARGVSAACMGPVPTEQEAMKALGPELQVRVIDFSEVNFFFGGEHTQLGQVGAMTDPLPSCVGG